MARESATALPDRASAFFNALLTEQFVLQSVRGVTVGQVGRREQPGGSARAAGSPGPGDR